MQNCKKVWVSVNGWIDVNMMQNVIYRLHKKFHFFVELNIGIENNDFFSNLEIHIANIKMIHYRNYTFLDQMNFSFIASTLRKLYIGTNLQSFQMCWCNLLIFYRLSFGNFVPRKLKDGLIFWGMSDILILLFIYNTNLN